jgi:nucleotide-binding universal stress UspA family protein
MLSHILVPLDGSPLAESVLPQVVELANLRKAEVALVRVALAHTFPGANPADAQVRAVESAQRYLTKIEANLAAQGIAAQSVVRYGHAAEEILDHARTGAIDLIAMSTHGRSGIRRWALGSVAETVARRAPVPVMLLHARGRVAAPKRTAPTSRRCRLRPWTPRRRCASATSCVRWTSHPWTGRSCRAPAPWRRNSTPT